MFALEPFDNQSVDVDVWGSPLHGLYEFVYGDPLAVENLFIPDDRSGVTTFVGTPAVFKSRSVENWMSTPEARLIDTGATFERDNLLEDFDETNGNEWRAVGITNAGFHWTRLNQAGGTWVYTDPNKDRWTIAPIFTFFKPNRIIGRLETAPFGTFKYPNEFWGIDDEPDDDFPSYTFEIDGPAGIVDTGDLLTSPYLLDITNDGTQGLLALGQPPQRLYNNFVQGNFSAAINFKKSGANVMDGAFNHHEIHAIYLFTLSGIPNDPDNPFVVDFSIFKDQAAASGTKESEQNDEVSFRVWSAYYAAEGGNPFSRPFLTTVPPGSTEEEVSAYLPHITIGTFTVEELDFCGWSRRDCEDNNHLADDPFNPTATKWIQHTGNPDQNFEAWEASFEYKLPPDFLEDSVQYNGFLFLVSEAHTSDPLFQPGVGGSWQVKWDVQFDAAEMAIGDIPLWTAETTYSSFDAVHDGAANYYIAMGTHESDDSEESINEPGVGSDWPNFWNGPFSVALTDFWVDDKVFSEGWIIRNEYTEDAFSDDAILDVNTATFLCIRSHLSTPDNDPGNGDDWRIYWEKANEAPASFVPEWVPPIEYEFGDEVDNLGGGGDDLRYIAAIDHVATDTNRPPSGNWVEKPTQPVFCPALLANSIGGTSYHLGRGGSFAPSQPGQGRGVTGHKAENLDIDYDIRDIYAWAHFRDDNTIKEYTVDVRYRQTKRDLDIDMCWQAPGRRDDAFNQPQNMEDDDVVVYSGRINRGPSTVDEILTYKFRTDGVERHEITLTAEAQSSGEDIWTENFSTYPIVWSPSSTRTLEVQLEGVSYASINESFSAANENDPPGSFNKQDWGPNGFNQDFCSGITFEFIDNPYLEPYQTQFENALGNSSFPGPKLTTLFGNTVTLEPIDPNFDDQFDSRPQRTQDQKDVGDPVPTILFTVYSQKLVGMLVAGRKNHQSGVDGQYDNILEPSDFEWQQFGVFAPDAEASNKLNLKVRSPTVGVVQWLKDGLYGDDISCSYDPFTHAIERNNQYKVVWL